MALAALSFTSCKSDLLDTNPTDQVSGDTMLKTTDGGYMALNGMIRYFWQWGQTTTGNYHQCFGPQSYNLMADLMGEDMVMSAQGSGWFWFDYLYNVKMEQHRMEILRHMELLLHHHLKRQLHHQRQGGYDRIHRRH